MPTGASPPKYGGRIRILFIAHDAGMFGAQRVLLTLLEGIDRSRFECHVVVPEDGPFVSEVGKLGHPVHVRHMVRWMPAVKQVQQSGLLHYVATCLGGLRSRAWAIASLIERHEIDLVYTNTVTCLEGAVAARMASIPHVWYVTEPISDNPELRSVLPALAYRFSIGMLSTELIFCSRSLAAQYGKLQYRSRVVYPGLPLPEPQNRDVARKRLLTLLALDTETKLVGVVAALQPRKDHATFLAAAKLLCERRSDVFFLVIGAGNAEYTKEIDSRIQALGLGGSVKMMGWWPGQIHELVAGLDVLVISSIQESFGLTAIEALAVETPVVSTRCGGPSEVIREEIDGKLVPIGDARAMAMAIDSTLSDPAAAHAQARSGKDRVTEAFTKEAFVKALQDVMDAASCARGGAASQTAPSRT